MTPEEREKLIERYADGCRQVTEALQGFPPGSLTARPLAGKWSAAEIVHHLADSESISAQRLRALLAQDHAVIHAYDQEAYATRLRYQERPVEPALELFRAARAATVPLLRAMSEAEWAREGWHTETGSYTPERWLAIYAAHAHEHAAQIRRLREALGK